MEQRAHIQEHTVRDTRAIALVETARDASYGLTLLHGVLAGEAGQAVMALLQELSSPLPQSTSLARAYSRAFRELAAAANVERFPHLPDAWQAYLLARLIDDCNPWSAQVERLGRERISPTLRVQARRDLRALQRLFELDAATVVNLVCDVIAQDLPVLRDAWEPWHNLAPRESEDDVDVRATVAALIAECSDWAELVTPLEEYWSLYGTGPLARYQMLRWQSQEKQLVGITHPDRIVLSGLVGYERQKARLRTNIEHFLACLPAHDILLYGAPGTGKSSTVKALVNTYAQRGLRLVEIRKEEIADLPQVVALLRERAPHYLLFIDDLSFEEHETAYKVLKVLLEGTAEARPANVLICATTNRMNLVRENFSERGKPGDDVNWRDSMDEKQSLVHRFGLRVTFSIPDQEHYLRIAEELARQRGLTLSTEELRTRALQWEHQHVGRSGRLARQFVDDLEAELKSVEA